MTRQLQYIHHVFAVVLGVADEFLAVRINDEIECFERNLPNANRAIIG